MFDMIKPRTTQNGITVDKCIRPGVEDPLAPIGVVAGDTECYETFRELFFPVVEACHGTTHHKSDQDASKLDLTAWQSWMDPYCISSRVEAKRNLKGIAINPSASKQERREAEHLLVNVLGELQGDLKGDYHPLTGSNSFPTKPGGMSVDLAASIKASGCLFEPVSEAEDALVGSGRDWPDARGVYLNVEQTAMVWCNDHADHSTIVARGPGTVAGIKAAFARFVKLSTALEEGIGKVGHTFAHHEQLGYLTASPGDVGTALKVTLTVKVPKLAEHVQGDWAGLCEKHAVVVAAGAQDGTFEVSNKGRLGSSEVDLVGVVAVGAAALVGLEKKLEDGEEIADELA